MDFDAIFELGALALLLGLLATICFYVKLRRQSRPGSAPAFVLYFGIALLVGIGGYILGTAIGVYFACSPPDAGNLCGLFGVFGLGPLLAGLALSLYGLSWTPQSDASAPVRASLPERPAGGPGWTGHSLVRVLAGLAGAAFALYGAAAIMNGEGQGAAAMVVGGAGVHWGLIGRLPSWFRR